MSNLFRYVLSFSLAGACACIANMSADRLTTVAGSVLDMSTEVEVTVTPASALPGSERTYTVPVAGSGYSKAVTLFPGENTILVDSDDAQEEVAGNWEIAPAPSLTVKLAWTDSHLDYDLYVNDIFYGNPSSSGGQLDMDSINSEWDPSHTGREVIQYSNAAPGLYRIYVNYYSDHETGSCSPTTVTVVVNGVTKTYSRTISESDWLGSLNGASGKSVWNVATVVVHSAEDAGGYTVLPNENVVGVRDMMLPQGCKVFESTEPYPGISPRTNFVVNTLTGPLTAGELILAYGQSAVLKAHGIVNYGSSFEDSRRLIEKFSSGNTSVAYVDALGVVSGIGGGQTTISCESQSVPVTVYKVKFNEYRDYVRWSEGGTYDAKAQLASDCYDIDDLTWAISTMSGSPADGIDSDGLVTFGSNGGRYKVTATSNANPDAKDKLILTVIRPNLEIPGVDEVDEETSGGFVAVNADDDDEDGVADNVDFDGVTGEDDLLPVVLQPLQPSCLPGSGIVTLTWTSDAKIDVYENDNKTGPVTSGQTFALSDLPKTLYVEGVAPSDTPRDIEIKLEYKNSGLTLSDIVKITAVHIDIDADLNRDGTYDEDDPQEHTAPGLVVMLNDDDDDSDGIVDRLDAYDADGTLDTDDDVTRYEDDLVAIKLAGLPADLSVGKVVLKASSGADKIKIWKTSTKGAGNLVLGPSATTIQWILGSDIANLGALVDTLYAEGVAKSTASGDVTLELEYYDPDGVLIDTDKILVTVLKVEFIDDNPDYSLNSNTDSDNFFVRHEDDFKNLDIYYRIFPADIPITDVKINIYEEDSLTKVMFGSADHIDGEKDASSKFKTGDNLHVKWTDARNSSGEFRAVGFYRLELEVYIDGMSTAVKTPIHDVDDSKPGWQCPQKGLGIHDLVWKHRPAIFLHEDEFSGPAETRVMLDRAELLHNVMFAPVLDVSMPVGQIDLATHNSTEYYLRYAGNGEAQDAGRTRTPSTEERAVYHHSIHAPGDNFVYVQSWQFEPSSFGIAAFADLSADPLTFTHDADWEMCQTVIRLTAPAPNSGDKSQWLSGYSVSASQHFRGQTLRWEEVGNGPEDADQDYVGKTGAYRPNVYIANRSHATYFRPNAAFRFALNDGDCLAYEAAPTDDARDDYTGSAPYTYRLILLTDTIIANWFGDWSTQGIIPNLRSPRFRESSGEAMYTNPRGFNNRFLKTGNDNTSDPAYIP